MKDTEEAILSVIEGDVLAPDFIERVIERAMAATPSVDRAALEAEQARLPREIENLTTAIAAGGDIPALAQALRDRGKRLKDVAAALAPRELPDVAELRAALEQRVSEWRGVLRKNPRQGRMVLETLMGPLELAPPMDAPDWAWKLMAKWMAEDGELTSSAEAKPLALLAGTETVRKVASPAGFVPEGNARSAMLECLKSGGDRID